MEKLKHINDQYLFCLETEDFESAFKYASYALTLLPDHPQILGDLALCHMRLGRFNNSKLLYETAISKKPDDANLYDGLTELYGLLGDKESAKESGRKALELKANVDNLKPAWKIPRTRPVRLSSDTSRNVIAFSLFGSNPRYCETAILNVEKAKSLFPNWKCRFYLNKTVPDSIQQRLIISGAQIISTNSSQWHEIHPLMWRFTVMDDSSVDRFLLRDADSILSVREQYAVQQWLDSDKWFHHMRDYYTHTELILAGLFGGSAGVFSNLKKQIKIYTKIHQGEQRVVDQHFLRRYVWPTVRENLMSHDSWFDFGDANEFPETSREPELGESFHVGCNYSTSSIGEDGLDIDVNQIVWQLLDEKHQLVCSYASEVVKGSWRASLPKTYIENIRSNLWKIRKA